MSFSSIFLGPKAENADIFERLLLDALRDHVFWRRNFHPEDGFSISESSRRTAEYERDITNLSQELQTLLAELKGGVPFFSPRYIGHMVADLTMASLIGYFATMLYNPNNVSLEASPVTTRMELEVAAQLARMVGFDVARHWGHLTSGGTVANFEAFWVARNVKYLPVAVFGAAEELGVSGLEVARPDGGRTPIDRLDLWALLNLAPAAALDVADAFSSQTDAADAAQDALSRHSLARVGAQEYGRRLALEFGDPLPPAVVLVPSTAHYSWQRICRALGIGSDQLRYVPVDRTFRLDPDALWDTLRELARSRTPVLAAVTVVGTTEESAVDQVDRIVEVRRRAERELGMSFPLHADAAWGGYAVAATRRPDGARRPYADIAAAGPEAWPSEEVYRGLCAIEHVDSITIDPHKLGFVPYPAGAVLFRDGRARRLVASDAPYVFHGSDDTPGYIGRFSLEGSKPGAAAAGVYLSHKVLPLDAEGHGRLVTTGAQGARRLHACLSTHEWAPFRIHCTPVPDINIVCFTPSHPALGSLEAVNAFVARVYEHMSVAGGRSARQLDFVVTMTTLRPLEYGAAALPVVTALGFTAADYERAGGVAMLRSTVMNPFFAHDSQRVDFVARFAETLLATLHASLPLG